MVVKRGTRNNDVLIGTGDNDTLLGFAGNDFLDGGFGFDKIDGGAGNDTTSYLFFTGNVIANLSTGIVRFPGNSVLTDRLVSIENINTGDGADVIRGTSARNVVSSGNGNDTIYGGGGNDLLDGGFGFDLIVGGKGSDTTTYSFFGSSVVADLISGVVAFPGNSSSTDTLESIENIVTGNADDQIRGTNGKNLINTAGGADLLIGRSGADTLIGGDGNDTFAFIKPGDSKENARDVIQSGSGAAAFQGAGADVGDLMDLSAIDANTNIAGDQAFEFGGTGIGRLSVVNVGAKTLIKANTDGDAAFEVQILIRDKSVLAAAYSADDFIL